MGLSAGLKIVKKTAKMLKKEKGRRHLRLYEIMRGPAAAHVDGWCGNRMTTVDLADRRYRLR
jgi:hypothetical protein